MPHSVLVVCDLHNGLPIGDDAGLVEVNHGLGVGCQGLTIVESIVHIDLQHRAVLELAWGRGREREEERGRGRGVNCLNFLHIHVRTPKVVTVPLTFHGDSGKKGRRSPNLPLSLYT